MERPVFQWATAHGSKDRIDWLKEHYREPITMLEYLLHEKQLGHNHIHPGRCSNPSRARRRYMYLKEQFGFFTPDARAE